MEYKMQKIFAVLAIFVAMQGFAEEQTYNLTASELNARESTMGVFWYQTSVEAKALYLQGYKIATNHLKEVLKKPHKKPYSIILDLDETVIDNSPFAVQNIKEGKSFDPKAWDEWVRKAEAKALPGAKAFLQFAHNNKVEIYYISDRSDAYIDATMKNLKAEGIPVQGRDYLLFKGKVSKTERREFVKKNTEIVMLFGDNICDFDEFSKTSLVDREKKLEQLQNEFGEKFIIFPNPMYGSFDRSLYKQMNKKGPAEEIEARRSVIKGYK